MRDGRTTTSEDRATQLLICEALSLAIRNGLKQEKFNCYQCNFTFAKIKLVLYTHDEKTLQRQLEQSHIGNLDQAKPYNQKWPETREI